MSSKCFRLDSVLRVSQSLLFLCVNSNLCEWRPLRYFVHCDLEVAAPWHCDAKRLFNFFLLFFVQKGPLEAIFNAVNEICFRKLSPAPVPCKVVEFARFGVTFSAIARHKEELTRMMSLVI